MLTFPVKPIESPLTYSAAEILHVTFDVHNKRIIVVIEYGNLVSGSFVPNKRIAKKTYTLGTPVFTAIAQIAPPAGQSIGVALKRAVLQALVDAGLETGSVS